MTQAAKDFRIHAALLTFWSQWCPVAEFAAFLDRAVTSDRERRLFSLLGRLAKLAWRSIMRLTLRLVWRIQRAFRSVHSPARPPSRSQTPTNRLAC